jgi:hypothetical protein
MMDDSRSNHTAECDDYKLPGAFLSIEPYPIDEGVLAEIDWWWTYGPQLAFALIMMPFLYVAGCILARVLSED